MDPITSIVTALASGAVAGLQPTVTQAIKDSYAALKELIKRKYTSVSIDQLEENPTSKPRRAVVEEDLARVAADKDEEVLRKAKELFDAIQTHARQTTDTLGVDLEDIKGASLTIDDIIATGTGVRARQVQASGDIRITRVRAGGSGGTSPKEEGQQA